MFALWPGAGQIVSGIYEARCLFDGHFLPADFHHRLFESELFVLPAAGHLVLRFFDTLNLRSMSYEFLPQDDFLFHLDSLSGGKVLNFFRQRHLLVGILLIVVGIYMLAELILPTMFYRFNIDTLPILQRPADHRRRRCHHLAGHPPDSQQRYAQGNRGRLSGVPRRDQIAVNPIRDASCRVKGRPFFLP